MNIRIPALLTALSISSLASANLVTNGSFEIPNIDPEPFVFYPDGSTAIEGWTVMAGDDPDASDRRMDITNTRPWVGASDGVLFVDLASYQGFNKGIQSIPINVISGQTYTLTFDIGNFLHYRSNVGVSFSTGEWSDGTTGEKISLNTAGPIWDLSTNWKKITLTWVAKNTTSTQISFYARDPGLPNTMDENYDENPLLDNVELTLLPPALISPVGVVSSTTPTFSWQATPDATSYLLSIADTSNSNATTMSFTAERLGCKAANSICAIRPASLANNVSYTAKVQPITNSSGWSPVQSFTIKSTTQPLTFSDNIKTNPYYTYVNTLAATNITTGMTDGTFGINNPITRGEMAAFVIRALEGEPAACTSADNIFTDVPYTHNFCKYIKRMKERNITNGKSPTVYGINDLVTRDQMAAFIVRALDGSTQNSIIPTCSTSSFGDVPTSHRYCGYINRLAELSVTQGCTIASNSVLANYCPNDSITRGQMAAFLSRAFLGM